MFKDSLLHPLPAEAQNMPVPQQFTFPFCYEPHPLCRLAAKEVMEHCYATEEMRPSEGKMFGVLVVEDTTQPYRSERECHADQLFYLAAFSGIYNGSYHHDGFVPTIYNLQNPDGFFHEEEKRIDAITQQINALDKKESSSLNGIASHDGEARRELIALRKSKSHDLQMWTFRQFKMLNAKGECRDLTEIFKDFKSPFSAEEYNDYKSGRTSQKPKPKIGIPPGGAGECCAPKLLQYAYSHNLKPICMAEFWVGPPPKDEMRTEGNYYPACQHKCKPILTHMLQGLDVEENPMLRRNREMLAQVRTLYEDDSLMVVYKPSGLLSAPGKDEAKTLLDLIRDTHPEAMLPHRLDMDTSGIMLVAMNEQIYKDLQAQFYRHEIKKKYIALLSSSSPKAEAYSGGETEQNSVFPDGSPLQGTVGLVSLPLMANPFDRPRQMVNHEHGKAATTRYEFLSPDRVALYPETGRTHQLRVHCAHPEGLGRPIKGDNLYGTPSDRLYLHAERIEFIHPVTMEVMSFTIPAEF